MNNSIDYMFVNFANMFSPFGKSIDSSSKKLFSGVWMVSALLSIVVSVVLYLKNDLNLVLSIVLALFNVFLLPLLFVLFIVIKKVVTIL